MPLLSLQRWPPQDLQRVHEFFFLIALTFNNNFLIML